MKNKLIITLLILFAGSLYVYSQTGKEILQKSINAMGVDKQASAKSTYMESVTSVMGQTVPMKVWKAEPKYRIESSQMGQNVIIVFNGTKGWMSMAGNVMEMPEDRVNSVKSQSSTPTDAFIGLLNNDSIKIEKVGKARIEGVTAYNLKITDADGTVSNMYINTNTYLPVKMKTSKSETGDVEVFFKNYKEFDGVKMPTKMIVKMQGMEITMEIKDFKINPTMDDSLFSKPE